MKYLLFISLVLIFNGCSEDREIKPAIVKYGQDTCTGCSMIISEVPYSAQYILTDGSVKKFDDIGCMIDYIKHTDNELDMIAAVYVHDYNSNKWIDAKRALFLHSRLIITPMGHGIIAFSNDEDLKKEQTKSGGKYLGNLLDLINQ